MRRPDFFIVGAPKAGTTALSRYLGDHGLIFMSNPKEPFFFCSDFSELPGPQDQDAYLDLFCSVDSKVLAVGEASAMYLYSQVAASRIRAFSPDAKIVIALRSPIDLAVSFHAQQLYGMSEDEPDFAKAWRLQEARAGGHSLPKLVREPSFLQYASVAKLGEQVERMLSVFDRSQIQFVVFDDLARDPGAVYRQILEFLNVPDDGREEFPIVNERKQNRSKLLGRMLHRPPLMLSAAARRLKTMIGRPDLGFLDAFRRSNATKSVRQAIPPEIRLEMCGEFEGDVALLSDLVGRDLTRWLD